MVTSVFLKHPLPLLYPSTLWGKLPLSLGARSLPLWCSYFLTLPFFCCHPSCLILEAWLPLFNYPPDGIQIRPLAWKPIFPRSWAGEWAGSPWNSDPETPVRLFPLSVRECRDQDSLPWLLSQGSPQNLLCFWKTQIEKCAAYFSKLCWKGNHTYAEWQRNARV